MFFKNCSNFWNFNILIRVSGAKLKGAKRMLKLWHHHSRVPWYFQGILKKTTDSKKNYRFDRFKGSFFPLLSP